MAKLTVTHANGTFEFSFVNEDWCSVFFSDTNRTIKLGSESFTIMRDRILQSLTNPHTTKTFTHENGKNLFVVTHLMDSHATLFATSKGTDVTLYYESTAGDFTKLLSLTQAEQRELLQKLSNYN